MIEWFCPPAGRSPPEGGVIMTRIHVNDLPAADTLTAEQEELIQGAGLRLRRPTLEGLEDRELMASHLAGALLVKPPAPDPGALSIGQFVSTPMQINLDQTSGALAGHAQGGLEQGARLAS